MSGWRVEFDDRAAKQLFKIGSVDRKRIRSFVEQRILAGGNPRAHGKALTGDMSEYWSYRVGDYRLLARIRDEVFLVLVVEVGNRRDVYR